MKQARRKFLASSVAGSAALVAWSTLPTSAAHAALSTLAAAGANTLTDAFKTLGAGSMIESRDILIKAPEIAENGAVVPIEVLSKLGKTQSIAVLIEKNANPLTANFMIPPGTEGYVSTRVKISASSPLHVVVQAGDKFYHAVKEVKVTLGGCGGTTQA